MVLLLAVHKVNFMLHESFGSIAFSVIQSLDAWFSKHAVGSIVGWLFSGD